MLKSCTYIERDNCGVELAIVILQAAIKFGMFFVCVDIIVKAS